MITLEQIERWRAAFNEGYGWGDMGGVEARKQTNAICDLAKIALTPPPDVAGLVEAIRNYEQASMDGTFVKVSRQACDEAADALLSLSARNRGLEAALRPFADEAKEWASCTHPDSFVPMSVQYTLGDLRRAANLQGNGDE